MLFPQGYRSIRDAVCHILGNTCKTNAPTESTLYRERQIVQIIASIATAILTAMGTTSCMGY